MACPALAQWRWTPEARRLVRVRPELATTPEEQLVRADQLYRDGDYRKAQAAYTRFLDYFPDRPEVDRVQFSIAECYEARGKLKTASEEFRKLIANHRDSEYYDRVVQKQYDIAEQFYKQYTGRHGFGRLFAGRHLKRAISVYEWLIENDPFGDATAEAQYRLAECKFAQGSFDEARFEYQRVLDQFPASRWASSALYDVAICDYRQSKTARYDQDKTKSALKGFQTFINSAGSDPRLDKAKSYVKQLRERLAEHEYLVAKFYERQGRARAALISYRRLTDRYPETSWTEKSQTAIGRLEKEAATIDRIAPGMTEHSTG